MNNKHALKQQQRTPQRRSNPVDDSDEWEDADVETALDLTTMSESSSRVSEGSRKQPSTPRRQIKVARSGGTPKRHGLTTPQRRSNRPSESSTPVARAAAPVKTRAGAQQSNTFGKILHTTLSVAFEILLWSIRLFHVILAPFYPYVAAGGAILLLISLTTHLLLDSLPPLLFRIPGHLLRLVLPSLPSFAWWTAPDTDTAVGQGVALLPLRLLATPVCTFTGQACLLSLASKRESQAGETRMIKARPFWEWQLTSARNAVDVGNVARNLAKEASGAKSIFESVARLSEGGLMDRLEHVRIWELGVAVQIGSNLEDREMLGQGLVELGNNAKDLSDELVEINAMAINAFTWLQWEFASVYRTLSLPQGQLSSAQKLAERLNGLLNKLSDTLTDLHRLTSRAHLTAVRGSDQGNRLRTNLGLINADLVRQNEVEPGWKAAVEKVNHFFVGGEPSKMERIRRDVKITRQTIESLSTIIQDLEISRTQIKSFRDQIGQFDASMMGFHMGANAEHGIGPEEELRILADVVAEFGQSIGRAKGGGSGAERSSESDSRRLEA
ncbi:hypothetical protein BD324DRAFT_652866 [Kockovaella imperatae]|uniref:Uncharacterized protein n=1 Tax=Kockovaella imperatae TaxID=4999 RepID=A0A1Y1UCA7_9TREE|nr:hypothetical protein BD324DRAFT_652866 [Kockovaella imperatae]ORX35154.1 hypothetical protein BD324DRAFT_652866 [Kockovaella imperatae]